MVKSAIQMNPNCPGYFYIAGCCDAYRRGAYQEAIEDAIRMNMPDYFHVPAMLAACFGQLGRIDEAKKSLNDLLAIRPDFASTGRSEYLKWYGPELAEHVLDGLRKAGLDIPDAPGAAPAAQGHS
jgi:tetratricopeptide (TPR) repeat protein